MVKSKKNNAVGAPAPDEKSLKKGKRNAQDDIGEAAKKQKTAREKIVPEKDDHGQVKKELLPNKEPARTAHNPRYSLRHQKSNASKVELGSISDDDNEPKTLARSSPATPLPNSLFVTNLSDRVNEKNLKNFFKNEGPIIGIKFDTFDDGSSKGSARVEFATAEAVEKACLLNNNLLMGRHVKLNYGHEHRMINPDSSYFQKPPHFSENTVLIKGFDSAYEEELMVHFLWKHFNQCSDAGEIGEISIQKDNVSGASEGIAFMEFSHPDCMPIALRLNGTVLRGFKLQVEKAKHVEGAAPVTCTAEGSTVPAIMVPIKHSTPSTGKRIVFSDEEEHVEEPEPSNLSVTCNTSLPTAPVTSAEGSHVKFSVPSTGKRTVFSEEEDGSDD